MDKVLKEMCKKTATQAIEWRHHLHENPELGFEEFKTTEFIESRLLAFGNIEIQNPTSTGVVGILRGKKPGKTLAFRADIDALPILESEDNKPRSKNDGVMHACGHDAHTAILLGVAQVLSQLTDDINGQIKFIFQPAEEKPPGGAIAMVNAGVMDDVDCIFALHCHVGEDPGKFIVVEGPLFASTYNFDINITGKQAHAAFPFNGIDSVLIASNVVMALNTLVPRYIDSAQRTVLTVCKINGGNSYNVIPETVALGGTIRFLDKETEPLILKQIEKISTDICSAYGANCQVVFNKGYDGVVNDPALAQGVKAIFESHFGKDNVKTMSPLMGGEDFSSYLTKAPGCYFRIGIRKEKADGNVYQPHSGAYELNDDALQYGIEGAVRVLLEIDRAI